MRRVLAAAVLALLAQAPRSQAALPVIAWCVSSPGADDYCSVVQERIVEAVQKRLRASDWELGQGLAVTRVQ